MAVPATHFQQLPLDGPRQVVVADGDLDMNAAPALAAALDEAIENGKTEVVIDLSRVTFLDSTIVHVLVAGAREVRQQMGRLAVVCPDPNVRRVLDLVRLDLVAPLFETREAALRGLIDRL